MSVLMFLLKISRPRFWIYLFGPYLVGLASGAALSTDLLQTDLIVYALYFLFPANLLVYGINDIFDYETDKSNPKKQEYESLVSPENRPKLLFFIVLSNLPFILYGLINSTHALPALAGFLFFSIFYSAPPVRAKAKAFLDSAFNILYVFPGIFAFTVLTGEFPPILIVAAAALWTAAMHAYSAIPDINADKTADIRTIATVLGEAGTLFFCGICYAVSAIISAQYLGTPGLFLGLVYLVMIAITFLSKKSERLFAVYRLFPIVNTVIGFLLFWLVAVPKIVK